MKDTAPGIKGATATNQLKEAELETGLKTRVPPLIGIGEKGRGRRIRVAGGVLYLAVRKARRIRDVATGALITVPEVRRLVWKGPRLVD